MLLHCCTPANQRRQIGLSLCADSPTPRLSACASPCRSQEATEQAEAELLCTGALRGAGSLETICEERPPSGDTVQSSSLQELQPEGEAYGCRNGSLAALLHGWSVVNSQGGAACALSTACSEDTPLGWHAASLLAQGYLSQLSGKS